MISEKAYAKVNLSLYITGIREDGYHLLDTVMQRISLFDTVDIRKNNKNSIEIISDKKEIANEKNICYAAATVFFEETGINDGIIIEVQKNIPLAAGLGGGSADAAAVLKILNRMYDEPLDTSALCKLGLKLGADVPFCIKGGSARVKGIGEIMESFDRKLPLYLVLVKDSVKASTGQMYKELDNIERDKKTNNNDLMVKSMSDGNYDRFIGTVHNDFSYVWDYENISQDLLKVGADNVSISGSGPTVIGFYKDKETADFAARKLSEKYSEVYSVQGVDE